MHHLQKKKHPNWIKNFRRSLYIDLLGSITSPIWSFPNFHFAFPLLCLSRLHITIHNGMVILHYYTSKLFKPSNLITIIVLTKNWSAWLKGTSCWNDMSFGSITLIKNYDLLVKSTFSQVKQKMDAFNNKK